IRSRQTAASAAAISEPEQPAAGRRQGQSDTVRPGRGRKRYRRGGPARSRRADHGSSAAGQAIAIRRQRSEHSRGPDPDRDIAGLGDRPAMAAGATNGKLMSGRRSEHPDDLLLIAATTLLVLAAQRYFQSDWQPRS